MASIIEIQNFSDPALDLYARLTENQLLNRADPENALFIAESPLVIGRALDAGCKPVSFLMERQHIGGKGREILARCCQDIPVYTAEESVLAQLTGFHLTRGMLCAMRRPKLPSVEEVCRSARRIVVLENVMNPTNIGALTFSVLGYFYTKFSGKKGTAVVEGLMIKKDPGADATAPAAEPQNGTNK